MRRNLLRTYLLALSFALALALPAAPAGASGNTVPSKAVQVSGGKPFSGIWEGTPYGHGPQPSHWWRLPATVRSGDAIQLAVDNRLSKLDTNLCLIQPVDDFGANDAFSRCYEVEPEVAAGQQDRLRLTYEGASGQAYLVAWPDYCCLEPGGKFASGYGQYTMTIEQIVQLVNIGFAAPPALPSTFTLTASVVYGDNTPVVDGVPAVLQWRPVAPRGSTPAPFADLVHSTAVGGVVTFGGAMPAAAQGQRIQMRACVAQPGGAEVRCGASGRTLVAESSCSRALDNQLRLTRAVQRLRQRVRTLRAGPAKLRLKRKLKAKQRRLAKANRGVKAHCG